ncbi:MAG TPA: hypothetical protein VFS60_08805, partial [Thermoanaerobaculia bacterium]|nr:hypothetical protein [Thermoanaerobaculia bacterium]
MSSHRLEVASRAKVNLHLQVIGRRGDGYHELRTIFQEVDLADELTLELGEPGVRLAVQGATLPPRRAAPPARRARGSARRRGRPLGRSCAARGSRRPA